MHDSGQEIRLYVIRPRHNDVSTIAIIGLVVLRCQEGSCVTTGFLLHLSLLGHRMNPWQFAQLHSATGPMGITWWIWWGHHITEHRGKTDDAPTISCTNNVSTVSYEIHWDKLTLKGLINIQQGFHGEPALDKTYFDPTLVVKQGLI